MKRLKALLLTGAALVVIALIAHASDTNTVLSVGGGSGGAPGAVTKVVSSGSTPTEIIDQTTRSIENGDVRIKTLGKGLKIKEGSIGLQGTMGTILLASPSVLFSNANVTASTRVFYSRITGNTVNGLMYATNCPGLGIRFISNAETNTFNVLLIEGE